MDQDEGMYADQRTVAAKPVMCSPWDNRGGDSLVSHAAQIKGTVGAGFSAGNFYPRCHQSHSNLQFRIPL